MIYALNIYISPLKDCRIPIYTGELINAVFYTLIDRFDKKIFERIHNNNSEKSFTVSPLAGNKLIVENGKIIIKKKRDYFFRLTLLDENLYDKIINYMMSTFEELKLSKYKFKITNIEISTNRDKMVDFTTYERIYKNASSTKKKLNIVLYTPTTFKVNSFKFPFPSPELVFKSLLHKWNTFSPIKLDKKLMSQISNIVYINQYNLKTDKVRLNKTYIPGAIGEIEYIINSNDKTIIKQCNVLKDYIFYAGVGYRTTMGMGLAK